MVRDSGEHYTAGNDDDETGNVRGVAKAKLLETLQLMLTILLIGMLLANTKLMRTKAQREVARKINANILLRVVTVKVAVFTGQPKHAENTLGLFRDGSIKVWDEIAGHYTGVTMLSQLELLQLTK